MLFGLLVALKYNLEVMIFGEGYEGYTDTDTHDENSMNFNMRQQNSSWEMGQLWGLLAEYRIMNTKQHGAQVVVHYNYLMYT